MGQQLAMGPIFCIFYRHRSSSGLLSLRWDLVKRESQGTHIRPVQWWLQHDWKPLGDTYVYTVYIYISTSKRNYITKLNNNLYVTSWPSSGGIVFTSLQHTSTVSVFLGGIPWWSNAHLEATGRLAIHRFLGTKNSLGPLGLNMIEPINLIHKSWDHGRSWLWMCLCGRGIDMEI